MSGKTCFYNTDFISCSQIQNPMWKSLKHDFLLMAIRGRLLWLYSSAVPHEVEHEVHFVNCVFYWSLKEA